jgi:hypothetical protein
VGFGPVGASFLRKSCSEESSLSVEPLSPLPHSQPMFDQINATVMGSFGVVKVEPTATGGDVRVPQPSCSRAVAC